MNTIDRALQANTPAVMVPCHEPLEPMTNNGHRFLVAHDGLWLEARRSWCHIVWPLAEADPLVRMPFGKVDRRVELAFGRLPYWAVVCFAEQAVRDSPLETAGVVIWNESTGVLRYEECRSIMATTGFIRSERPALKEGDAVVIDFHSHGKLPSFFSEQDRRDIGSEVVLAGVVGRTDQAEMELKMSLFACGLEIPVAVPQMERRERLSAQAQAGILVSVGECNDDNSTFPAG